ncbi:hypothetical protein D3C87_1974230 [compost metagenome]
MDDSREIAVAAHALLDRAAGIGVEHTDHIFAGEHFVVRTVSLALVWRRHRSKHSLNFNRLRRNQVRIVFSGTPNRSASS